MISHDQVEIIWNDDSHNISDSDDYPGYLIQFVVIDDFEQKEVDNLMFYERDICSSFGWRNVLVKREDVRIEESSYKFTIDNLDQYTTYAFTVQIFYYETAEYENYSKRNYSRGASEPKVFRTEMIRPSRVKKIESSIKTTTSIMLTFDVIKKEISAIVDFLFHVYEEFEELSLIDKRNYCKHSSQKIEIKENEPVSNRLFDRDERDKCCEMCCDIKAGKDREANDDEFQNHLIAFSDTEMRENPFEHRIKMKKLRGFKEEIWVNGDYRNYTFTNLKPFTLYKFYIYACTKDALCSEYDMHFERTAADEKFDRVSFRPMKQSRVDQLVVHFDEPNHKNGAILNYVTELRENFENSSVILHSECVSRKRHQESGYK